MNFNTINDRVAITPPQFSKIETEVIGGIARNQSRLGVSVCEVLMSCDKHNILTGDRVILRGDAGVQSWAKQTFNMKTEGGAIEFCLVPVGEILAVEHK